MTSCQVGTVSVFSGLLRLEKFTATAYETHELLLFAPKRDVCLETPMIDTLGTDAC